MAIEAGRIVTVADFQRQVGSNANRTVNSSGFTTTEVVLDTITVSLVAGVNYRVLWRSTVVGGSGDLFRSRIRETNIAGTELNITTFRVETTAVGVWNEAEYTAVSTGSKTFVVTGARISGAGTLISGGSGTGPTLYRVEVA